MAWLRKVWNFCITITQFMRYSLGNYTGSIEHIVMYLTLISCGVSASKALYCS